MTGNRTTRDRLGEQNSDVHHQGIGRGKPKEWKETVNTGLKGKPNGRWAHSDKQACTITHEDLSRTRSSDGKSVGRESLSDPQQSVDPIKAQISARPEPRDQVSHGSVFGHPTDNGDPDQWNEGTLGARLIGVRDVLGASVLLRNILKSKYYWEVGSIDKYVFWGSIYIGENDDTL